MKKEGCLEILSLVLVFFLLMRLSDAFSKS